MIGMIERNFEKIAKQLKLESKGPKKSFQLITKNDVFPFLLLNFEIFCVFLKYAPEYINPSGHLSFMKFCEARTFFG